MEVQPKQWQEEWKRAEVFERQSQQGLVPSGCGVRREESGEMLSSALGTQEGVEDIDRSLFFACVLPTSESSSTSLANLLT